jgi:hypothetical protein
LPIETQRRKDHKGSEKQGKIINDIGVKNSLERGGPFNINFCFGGNVRRGNNHGMSRSFEKH